MSDHEETKLPLDQINRDWTKGNCYMAALEYIKKSPTEDRIDKPPVRLVHGVTSFGQHAWIESGERVWDNANNNGIDCTIEEYREHYKAMPQRRFTRKEADAILVKFEQPSGLFSATNWSQITDEEVQSCLDRYDPETSPFARDVWFSNPKDPKNRENLIIPSQAKQH
ncbi:MULTISPECIES: hypothetical protein [unclassified Lentimonas]|uniref:hypothetical protein n=1 Tax=unclassified Lentimonas TaxID=2630993 RepID=UPI0013214F4C|nr:MULTISPECIES: hypothetical protein [unclassified Lentimonas]CAA6677370.1 Unannotated [Lentimonas sp. CC4]CAA6686915.1 Unannotated [Lentimonas sp. CC6]CAA6690098.1 Unannotated [Lentimonas sp. CC19]CAA6690940.1 Unannotated [Lentimonas sp. CC10]CAA7070708.1 Unannotated [Lentimonas sp. CC11]